MGRARRELKAAARRERVHRTQLFGGRSTAEEVHAKMAFPAHAKCVCGRRPEVRAITLAPLDEARRHFPDVDRLAEYAPQELLMRTVAIRESPMVKAGKPYVRLGVAYACKSCAPTMERALAKLPSWVIVEINRGPGPERPVVGVV